MKDLTKIYIDLSKCSEREIISIAFLTQRTVNLHNKAFSYMSKGETLKDFVCLAATDSGEWTLWNKNALFNKAELTYPEFIKLFEGGEGEKKCCDNPDIQWNKIEVSIGDKQGSYKDLNFNFCDNCGETFNEAFD